MEEYNKIPLPKPSKCKKKKEKNKKKLGERNYKKRT